MLKKYWPWGCGDDAKPRGLRNLRLEELFPNKDYENAKRFVGTLSLERGGGGAPIIMRGNIIRTHEDPSLRFQFGSKDLRRWVDNILRYKTDRKSQQEYKKQLDKQVEEKILKENKEKSQVKLLHQEQGWSNGDMLKQLEKEDVKNKLQNSKYCNTLEDMNQLPRNNVVKFDLIDYPRKNFITFGRNRKLSPLLNSKGNGVELVRLLAKNRKYPPRIPLCSSDITSEAKMGKNTIWNRQGSAYLKELSQQITYKKQTLKDMKDKENESVECHFSTWNGYWGRPGHGAPLPEIKKKSLQNMLFPQFVSNCAN